MGEISFTIENRGTKTEPVKERTIKVRILEVKKEEILRKKKTENS